MTERSAQDGLRALLLTLDFPPTRGGIQTMAREIIARADHVRYRVIAPADAGADDAAARFPVRRVRRVAPGRRGYVPTVASAAFAEARARRPDAALAMHALAAPGALLAGIPTVVVVHGGELRSSRIRAVARRVLTRASRVVANSAYTRTLAVELGADPMRVSVLPVGAPDPVVVDPGKAAALRTGLGGGRIVLSVARLAPHKGIDRLIGALPDVDDDVRLVVVGTGDERDALAQRAQEAGVAERVVFAGEVDDASLPVYYEAADAFALMSRTTASGVEGGGIVLLEACAYGLPVVAAATGGIPETIRDGDTGLLVDPDDRAAIARGLRRVLDDRALADRLGANARAMATGERSWGSFVRRIETILEQAAAKDR